MFERPMRDLKGAKQLDFIERDNGELVRPTRLRVLLAKIRFSACFACFQRTVRFSVIVSQSAIQLALTNEDARFR